MRNSIDTYVKSIAKDNKYSIIDCGYESIADYIISNAEATHNYNEFFDDSEINESWEPSEEQIEELKTYLNNNYNYLPE